MWDIFWNTLRGDIHRRPFFWGLIIGFGACGWFNLALRVL